MNGLTGTTGGLSRLDLERAAVAELERVLRGGVDLSNEAAIAAAAFVGGSIAAAIVNLSPRQRRAMDRLLRDPSKLAAKIIKLLLVDAAQASEGRARAEEGASRLEGSLPESGSERSPQRNGLASVLVEEWAGQVAGSTYLEETLRIPRSTLHRWQRRGEVIALRTGGRKHVFPLAQFVDGRPVPGIRDVLEFIGHPRTAWSWLIRPASEFDGEAPLALLVKDHANDVIRAAEAFAAAAGRPTEAA
ncbi:MAG TPA: hypothetical protein VGV39_09605 [Mesorhizobium sp.]|uniref:antitoxin Xre/MbcA/ParS-like domain-containing protein n=1 Tax=Mesorhizobium sp. TaxID=1871066 RepID=UPI002DDD6FB8|nr:hypothetical protein [Mesorhizobium sp.]HEV2503321.1 hypothetical protein [Mesorhizobium sp.]